MTLLDNTPWVFQTSEEDSYSGWIISGGEGKIYLAHDSTGEELVIKYNFFALGTSKGAVINFAQSVKSDPSSGITNAQVRHGWSFGRHSFPCHGWMVIGGATAGIFQPSFLAQSGVSAAIMLFGVKPFAGLPMWGRFNSILPSVGPSAAFCHFSL